MPVGIDVMGLEPVHLDFDSSSPHLLIVGQSHNGRAALLRCILAGLVHRYTPNQVRFLLIDGTDNELTWFADDEHVMPFPMPSNKQTTSRMLNEDSGLPNMLRIARETEEFKELIGLLEQESTGRRGGWQDQPHLFVIINSYDTLTQDEKAKLNNLSNLVQRGPGRGIHFIATVNNSKVLNSSWLGGLYSDGTVVFLEAPTDIALGIRFPRSPIASDPSSSKGFLVMQGQIQVVQFVVEHIGAVSSH